MVLGCCFNPWGPSASVSPFLERDEGVGIVLTQLELGCPIRPGAASPQAHRVPGHRRSAVLVPLNCSYPQVLCQHKWLSPGSVSLPADPAASQAGNAHGPQPLARQRGLDPCHELRGHRKETAPPVTLLFSLPFRNTQVSHTVLGTNVSVHGPEGTTLGLERHLGLSGWARVCSTQAKLLLQSSLSHAAGCGAGGTAAAAAGVQGARRALGGG